MVKSNSEPVVKSNSVEKLVVAGALGGLLVVWGCTLWGRLLIVWGWGRLCLLRCLWVVSGRRAMIGAGC